MKKAVILAGGESLAQYNESEFEGAFVIAVNATPLKLKKERIDLVIAQDSNRVFRKKLPEFLKLDLPMQFISADWKEFVSKRDNAVIVESRPHTYDIAKVGGAKHTHGNMTAITAILEAMHRGYKEVYVFGHDCSAGHASHTDEIIKKTIKELNFCQSVAKQRGGCVYLASNSYLWKYNSTTSQALTLDKYEATEEKQEKKPSRRRTKKVVE